MKRKFFAAFLSLCMVIGLVPMTALAVEETATPILATDTALKSGNYVLSSDVTLSSGALTIAKDETVTIDLAGHTLTNKPGKHTIIISLGGSLTITDTVGTGRVDNVSHGRAAVENSGTVNILGGEYTRSQENGQSSSDNGGNSYYVLLNHGTMTIGQQGADNSGISVTQDGHYSSMIENGYQNYNSQHNENTNAANPTLTIYGGMFSGGLNTVKNDDAGVLTIFGGTFENVTQTAVMNYNEATIYGGNFSSSTNVFANTHINNDKDKGTLTIGGGTFSCDKELITLGYGYTDAGTVTISDGDFTYGTTSGEMFVSSATNKTVKISSGTFSQAIPQEYCSEEYAPLTQESGKYTVISKAAAEKAGYPQDSLGNYYESENVAVENNVASVTNADGTVTYYATLQEAIEKAENGDTVTLLKDVPNATGITVSSGKNFTVDFGWYTYTLTGPGAGSTGTETNGFQLLKDSTITFKNGTIRIAENANNIKRIIQNYADLTLEDMHIYAENQVGGEDYALSFNNGTILFKGNTSVFTTQENAIAFDVCKYASYPAVQVTFDEDYSGTIDGIILYDSSDADTHSLIIEGNNGTFGGIQKSTTSASTPNITVHGGKFFSSVAQYVADALNYEANNNGTYTYHKTLDEALAAGGEVKSIQAATAGSGNTFTVTLVDRNNTTEIKVANEETISLPIRSDYGYNHFVGWTDQAGKHYDGGDTVTITADTTFTAQWSYIPPANPNYKITIDDAANGTVTANPTAAKAGATVTLTPVPDEGYALSTLTVTDRFGDAVRVTEQADGTYTFTMPNGQVTVNATFVETEEPVAEPFVDVAEGDWFYDAVVYAYQNELMDGVGGNRFAPNSETTRAQLVTILYRLEGQPAVSGDLPFTDVEAGIWYTDAILWAAQNNIVNGVSDTEFAPGDDLTRQQLVTILYRYAEAKGYDVSASADLSGYPDADQVQDYAQPAMAWAVAENIIQGMEDGTLKPAGNASRAQIATILMRFCEDVAQ